MIFLQYPKCSTCQRAKKWLDERNIKYEDRHIVEERPTKEELTEWIKKSGYPVQKFFNTSGLKYRELNLKNVLKDKTEEEKIELLSSDGMLVKRPLIIDEDKIMIGFKAEEWENYYERREGSHGR